MRARLLVLALAGACSNGSSTVDAAVATCTSERPQGRPECPTGCNVFDCDSPCTVWCWETCVTCKDLNYDGTWEWEYSVFDCFGCLDDASVPDPDAGLDAASPDAGMVDAAAPDV